MANILIAEPAKKLGIIINALMDGKAPKKVAFDCSVGRDFVYQLKSKYPLFLGWTNEYGRDE